ncbi:MAG: hypothetical protein ACM30I_05750 [Gemmatimonas sp.]
MPRRTSRAVMVRNLGDALLACRAAAAARCPVTLVSPPGAGLFAGAVWFKALTALTRREAGATRKEVRFVLDCADAPGAVLAAVRAGVEACAFSGNIKARARLGEIAKRAGVVLVDPPSDIFRMSQNSDFDGLLAWFSSPGASLQRSGRSAKRTATHIPAPTRRGANRYSKHSRGAHRP